MTEGGQHREDSGTTPAETGGSTRGRLKILVGGAPGVGKTYEMLKSGREQKDHGVDVVVGAIETHHQRETEALLEGLELIPRRLFGVDGATHEEMDLDAILARRPQLVLVDELAHSNVEGSRHPKRHQDVEELLDAGIDVLSTLNIQHLESLNDVVARITQMRVYDTVPDRVFDTADEVEVVDLTPRALIRRVDEGKVHVEQDAAARAAEFEEGNLTALRELALRRTAERVDHQMRQYMREHSIRGPWAAGERILVCISESPGAVELVRRAKRVADRLDAPWFAIYVETARTEKLTGPQRGRIAETLRLAESLGAETLTIPGSNSIADDVLAYARDNNITQIVVGKAHRSWWFEWLHGSVVHDLVERGSGIDVHVLADESALAPPPPGIAAKVNELRPAPDVLRASVMPWRDSKKYLFTFGSVAAATLAGRLLVAIVAVPNISLIYLAAVLWSATRYGLATSLFASIASTLAYNFFFIEPIYNFTIGDPGQILALVFFCVAAVMTSTLTARERRYSTTVQEQARATAELYAFGRKLAGLRKLDTLMSATAAQVSNMLHVDTVLMLPNAQTGALVQMASAPSGMVLDKVDLVAANWCRDNNRPAGRGTDTMTEVRRLFLPLRIGQGKVGVVGVSRNVEAFLLTPAERRLLDALADLVAIAGERIRLAKDVDQARMLAETEKLRGSLLTSISKDLRSPLTAIIDSVGQMRAPGFEEAMRDVLLARVQQDAERLDRYLANLLDMTQLESGAVKARREPCDLRSVVDMAVHRTTEEVTQHRLDIAIQPGFPMLLLDAALLEQVLVNLVDNASRYTPDGSTIEISGVRHRFSIVIAVRDSGAGIPEGDLERVFEKFYRVREGAKGWNRNESMGTGLGLAVCRGFVEAMGGRIHVRNRSDGPGAEFQIEFSPDIVALATPVVAES